MPTLIQTQAFIDWDSARRIAPPEITRRKKSICKDAIIRLQEAIAESLIFHDSAIKYRIQLRLYHGWHQGTSPTEDRRELEKLQREHAIQRIIKNCSFAPTITFSDELLCGGKRSIIRDTLRSQPEGKLAQKMVDTSLVADLLHNARNQQTKTISIVIGDDDDLAPGLITADAWKHTVLLKRINRTHENKHLNLKGLLC